MKDPCAYEIRQDLLGTPYESTKEKAFFCDGPMMPAAPTEVSLMAVSASLDLSQLEFSPGEWTSLFCLLPTSFLLFQCSCTLIALHLLPPPL